MAYTSRYVQLNDFLLLEFRYADPVTPPQYSHSFIKVENGFDDQVQILNVDAATDDTGNVQEFSVVQTANGEYTDLDNDIVPTYLSYAEGTLATLTTSTVTAASLSYDECLVHMVSGYNFDDLDGVIVKVTAKERSGNELTLASIRFLKDSDFFDFNARPIWLGDRLYDRYFTVKIPSVKIANDIFYSLEGNPSQVNTFVAKITTDADGFLRANPLHVSVIEIKSTRTLKVGGARYKVYQIGGTKTVPINQSDTFALLSAVIQPSDAGDYFEYFASWNGGFIEDYIGNANALPENNYIVIHEIRVFEQVGSLFRQTDLLQTIQEEDFDTARKFRPVIENADKAVSFTLEYTVRLYNKVDSSQIIRTSSYTSYDVKQWGKSLSRIKILNAPETYKIYNRVVDGPTIIGTAFVEAAQTVQPFNTKYVPSFFDKSLISMSQDTVYLDQNGQLKSEPSSTTKPVYGQGDLTIVINPFDNFFKFSILKTDSQNIPVPLDLGTNAEYYMVFIDESGKKLRFPHKSDLSIGDASKGDLVFQIPEASSEKIVKFTNKEFYIISSFDGGTTDTQMYHGFFNKTSEIQQVKTEQATIKVNQAAGIEERIKQIEVKAETLQAQQNLTRALTPKQQAISIAATVEIPGLSSDIAAFSSSSEIKPSIVASFVPVSEQVKSVSTVATEQRLLRQSQQEG